MTFCRSGSGFRKFACTVLISRGLLKSSHARFCFLLIFPAPICILKVNLKLGASAPSRMLSSPAPEAAFRTGHPRSMCSTFQGPIPQKAQVLGVSWKWSGCCFFLWEMERDGNGEVASGGEAITFSTLPRRMTDFNSYAHILLLKPARD